MKSLILPLLLITTSVGSWAQSSKSILFLGNSYTAANDLPMMTSKVTQSMGDTLIYDSNAPGGYTLQGHSSNAASIAKIQQGNWNYVVLQEQSQLPAFPDGQVATDVYPYAQALDSMIKASNPCAQTVFYMTWGYKNGDPNNCAGWPPICTYEGMDSMIRLRYMTMAADNQSLISPVGAVRRFIRANFPNIELYTPDNSHPSVAGTYAAACCFYTILFQKDPTNIPFTPDGIAAPDAANIRQAVKAVAFDSLSTWHVNEFLPNANFTVATNALQASFTNNSTNASVYNWDFGDGSTATEINPTHDYALAGTYFVTLTASDSCGNTDTFNFTLVVENTNSISTINSENFVLYPNPIVSHFYIKSTAIAINKIVITNAIGQQVDLPVLITNEDWYFDSSKLPAGIYFAQIFDTKNRSIVKKFSKY